jgi:hypothetical protein
MWYNFQVFFLFFSPDKPDDLKGEEVGYHKPNVRRYST